MLFGGNRILVEALTHSIEPQKTRGWYDDRRYDPTTPVDCERPGRGHRGAPAERRQDRPYRAADDRQDQRQGFLRDSELWRIPRHGNQSAAVAMGTPELESALRSLPA